MSHFTRNALVLLVGILLLGFTDADAQRYQKYRIDVNKHDWSFVWPGRTSYDIEIRNESPYSSQVPVRRSDTMSYVGSSAIARVPDVSQIVDQIRREQERKRLVNAQVELLEAQTALLRQARRANSRPYRPPSEATQQAARKRLVARYAAQTSNSNPYTVYVDNVRLGIMTSEEAVDAYVRNTGGRAADLSFELWKEGLLDKPKPSTSSKPKLIHRQSTLSKLAVKLGLKKSHRCTADCVD